MHVIAPHQPAISLFNQAGLVRKYNSLAEALRCLGYGWIARNVGANFREFSYCESYADAPSGYRYGHPVYRLYEHIMRWEDSGLPVTAGDFADYRPAFRWSRRAYAFWDGTGPVPRTGRHGHGGYMRHPETQGLRRAAAHFAEEGEPPIRAQRNAAGLPTAWDDLMRQDVRNRNWKRQRKTQWKAGLGKGG